MNIHKELKWAKNCLGCNLLVEDVEDSNKKIHHHILCLKISSSQRLTPYESKERKGFNNCVCSPCNTGSTINSIIAWVLITFRILPAQVLTSMIEDNSSSITTIKIVISLHSRGQGFTEFLMSAAFNSRVIISRMETFPRQWGTRGKAPRKRICSVNAATSIDRVLPII